MVGGYLLLLNTKRGGELRGRNPAIAGGGMTTRRCSHCSNKGHNSRTCPVRTSGGGGLRLFGVRLTDGVGTMKKSASMGSLSTVGNPANASLGSPSGADAIGGYVSDDTAHGSCRSKRKKGTPWTEEEHRMFLFGLQKLGKGDWRGISRKFVVSRTPTQVASHAQKYFIRQTSVTRRKRRSSMFDMDPGMGEQSMDAVSTFEDRTMMLGAASAESESQNLLHPQSLVQDREAESMEMPSNNSTSEMNGQDQLLNMPLPVPVYPAFYPAFIPVSLPFWPALNHNMPVVEEEPKKTHKILKPIPFDGKELRTIDELLPLSRLSLCEGGTGNKEARALSLKLSGSSSARQSAFHHPSVNAADLSQSENKAIHAN